ncbi:MAG: TetR family transcriptional regulator [Clostridiales bacterium]|nr:TetR family transcriptional regulator [Clostridiales bacterium]
MPRVSEEYLAGKRKEITDAAHRVCLRKPVSMVTMMDIINETGMAQGNIYRYYTDLDDILRAMILDMRESYSIIEETDRIFENADSESAEVIMGKIFDMLADKMEEQLMDIQKINFDLSVMAINDPERIAKIMSGFRSEGNLEHLVNRTALLMGKAAASGELHPRQPLEDIIRFLSSSYSGIQMNCIISACYTQSPMAGYEPRKLFGTLKETMMYLLGL